MPAVFVLPSTPDGQQGPVAALLSTAGWASAARRVLGASWIVTPGGLLTPEAARQQGTAAHLASDEAPGWRRRIPIVAKTALKDVRQHRRARSFRVDPAGPWRGETLDFVWQRHELFHTAGADLATALDAPLVVFAPATAVWEAQRWGVRRPGWGPWLERTGEGPTLRAASVVAAGGDEVAEQVIRLGVDPHRVVITPTGVDLDLFPTELDRSLVRGRLGLGDELVVGWVGSFRRFHAIDALVDAMAGLDGVRLLLVGDGPERRPSEQRAAERGVAVTATGTVAHHDLPGHLAAMDVGVVMAPPDGAFHYSPLKLAEYLAAGLAVIAPRVPTVEDRVTDDVDALLVRPGDADGLRAALIRLRDDASVRSRLGEAARAAAVARFSWDDQVRRVTSAIDQLADRPR